MAYIGETIRDKPSIVIEGGIGLITTDKDINNSIMLDTSYKDTIFKFVNVKTEIPVNPHNNNFVIGEIEINDGGEIDVKYNAPSKAYTVTVQSVGGSNKYFIDGVQQKSLNLYKGGTYTFDYSAASSHPFKFSTTSDGTHNSGSEYTTGINELLLLRKGNDVKLARQSTSRQQRLKSCPPTGWNLWAVSPK